jgi:peptidoglycan/xylan/chitin deacetylase (PgdA/CDA1 family)
MPRSARGRALAALAPAALLLALSMSACGGSSPSPHAGHSLGIAAAAGGPGAATQSAGAHASAGGRGTPESPAVRRLISLGLPIYCAAARGNEVALTFDDGPGPYTRLVMKKLRKHHAAATFFDVGRNLDVVAHATRQERALGAVGDHSFSHPVLTAMSPGEAEREIARTQTALARSSGGPVFLFRPPYGARNQTVDQIVRSHGMLQIMWTVDSADSLGADYAQIERNVIGGLRGGAIILMHENHGQTVRALPAIFEALHRKHLRAVSVTQLLTDNPPSVAQVRAGGAGCGVSPRRGLGGG